MKRWTPRTLSETLGSVGAGELSYPHDAEFDHTRPLLVADTGSDHVAIYEIKGARPSWSAN
jgi:hypothetical protein